MLLIIHKKIALIFSAMRHFAKELKAQDWKIRYHTFKRESHIKKLVDFIALQQQHFSANTLVITQCGEYRLQHEIETSWANKLKLPVMCLEDDRFFCTVEQFKRWANKYKNAKNGILLSRNAQANSLFNA